MTRKLVRSLLLILRRLDTRSDQQACPAARPFYLCLPGRNGLFLHENRPLSSTIPIRHNPQSFSSPTQQPTGLARPRRILAIQNP